ncbi:MAG TPA: hypothetical protein VL754_10265 [Verrucomicrobiae bacterium]|nr:hypothetical protein [Verrucomicrobiae bacterium]
MRVKIFFFPYLMETAVALNPKMLENYARDGGVVYIRPFGESIRKSLLSALGKIQIREKLDSYPDLRWGAVFYDIADREVHAIYMGSRMLGSIQHGMIDGESLTMNPALTDWFEITFPDVMRAADDRRFRVDSPKPR